MRKRRTYTEEEKAEVLATLRANGGNIRKTSQMTGLPRRSISYFLEAKTPVPQVLVEERCTKLADRLDAIADTLAGHLTDPEKLAKANLQQVAVTFGIVRDKAALARGNPTSITQRVGEKERYEIVVKQYMDEMRKLGQEIDRAEALDLLEPHIPELRQYVN